MHSYHGNDFGVQCIILANLSLDFFSMIDNSDKLEIHVGVNEQSFSIGFLGGCFIHHKGYWIEINVYSNIHQVIRKNYCASYNNQGWVSVLLVCYSRYLLLLFHRYWTDGCSVDLGHTLMNRCNFNIRLGYLDVVIHYYVKGRLGHSLDLIVKTWLFMIRFVIISRWWRPRLILS